MFQRLLEGIRRKIEKHENANHNYPDEGVHLLELSQRAVTLYEKQEMTTERLLNTIENSVPLSETMREDIDRLKKWASGRARPATSSDEDGPGAGKRKLEI